MLTTGAGDGEEFNKLSSSGTVSMDPVKVWRHSLGLFIRMRITSTGDHSSILSRTTGPAASLIQRSTFAEMSTNDEVKTTFHYFAGQMKICLHVYSSHSFALENCNTFYNKK